MPGTKPIETVVATKKVPLPFDLDGDGKPEIAVMEKVYVDCQSVQPSTDYMRYSECKECPDHCGYIKDERGNFKTWKKEPKSILLSSRISFEELKGRKVRVKTVDPVEPLFDVFSNPQYQPIKQGQDLGERNISGIYVCFSDGVKDVTHSIRLSTGNPQNGELYLTEAGLRVWCKSKK